MNMPFSNIVSCGSCGLLRRWNKPCQKCGRPSTYRCVYAGFLYQHLASGKSFSSFAKVINVKRDTLYAWEYRWPEFSDARKRGIIKFYHKKIESYLNYPTLSNLHKALRVLYKVQLLKGSYRY